MDASGIPRVLGTTGMITGRRGRRVSTERNTPVPLTARLTKAWHTLRGAPASDAVAGDATRAIISTTYPTIPGQQQMSLVRTANPQEYKPDGAAIRTIGFTKHPVVHACIRVVSDIVASVPLIVLTERGNQESAVPESNPLQRLLDYPGPRFTARQFRAKYAIDFLGYGNAFFQLERPGPNRAPVGIRGVNAESIQSVWVDSDGDPRRYDYGNWAGLIVQVPAEDMLHFKDLEMSAPFQPDVFGFPRGATALQSIAADNEATHYVRQVVTNDGTPTFAVLLADEATQDDAQAMQDRYRERVVNRGKRGSPAFFGAVRDIKPLGFTLSDLEFPDLRRVSREDICAAYGVDPRMIGIASASSDAGLSGAQYAEARARLVQHTIEPMLSAIEDELNHWLAPEFGDVWISYDRDVLRELVENDTETSTRVRAEFAASLRTWEESRTALRLPPVPVPTDAIQMTMGTQLVPAALAVLNPASIMDQPVDGTANEAAPTDTTPSALPAATGDLATGDLATAIATVTAAGGSVEFESATESKLEAGDASASDAGDAEEALDEEARSLVDASPIEPVVDARRWWERLSPEELRQDRRYQYWQRAMDELNRREIPWYQKAKERFAAERQSIGELFAPYTRAYKTKAQILAEIERRIREGYKPGGEYYEAWQREYEALIGDLYMVGARQVAGVGLSFSLQSPQVLQAITNRASRLAELVGETTSTQILSAIRASQLAGFSVAETARLVQQTAFGELMTDNRATMIARTESAGAMSQGSWDQAQEMGDLYRSKEWLAFEDERTRETHLDCMAQGVVPADATFSNGLMYPLDPAGDAAEVINCRCVLAYYDQTVGELT